MQVLTLQIIRAITILPNQKRERTTGKKRLKGHGPGHTQLMHLVTSGFHCDMHTSIFCFLETFLNELRLKTVQTPVN